MNKKECMFTHRKELLKKRLSLKKNSENYWIKRISSM